MSVLTLKGQPIDWARPPAPTAKVMWSRRDQYGRQVTGSLRAVAFIDHLDTLAVKKFNKHIVVIQPPYNTGVAASEGTHDFDFCFDWDIPGVSGPEKQAFGRANGMANWWRKPPLFPDHQHGFPLPPAEGVVHDDDFKVAGFKVGKYVDGGVSLFGRLVASSQIADYYGHRTGLSGHAPDPSWFPADIKATIFNLNDYIASQRVSNAVRGPEQVAVLGSHGPLARLGGAKGEALWETWEAGVRGEANSEVRRAVTTFILSDTNKHGKMPNFGRVMKSVAVRIGGRGIDLIAVRRAAGGAKVRVVKRLGKPRRKVVDLHIDGHDAHGVLVQITFPSGAKVKVWLVQANLGRGVSDAVFRRSCQRIRKAFGRGAIYCFNEIDEADGPKEHPILREVFTKADFDDNGWSTYCPTLVGRKNLRIVENLSDVKIASPGMAKVSPARVVVTTVVAPK